MYKKNFIPYVNKGIIMIKKSIYIISYIYKL